MREREGSTMSFSAFLRRARKLINDLNSRVSLSDEIHFVLGNESCDLDSAISSILYAWFLSEVQQSTSPSNHIPILNIPESAYRLRTETVHLLRKYGISQNDLIFRDSVEFSKIFTSDAYKMKLILVDHHVLPKCDEYLYSFVSEVIDHRPQARTFDSIVNVEIATVGSCTTLIAERILAAIDDERIEVRKQELDAIASFISGPILLDTVNLSEAAGKVTERDLKVIRKLWKDERNPELARLFQELGDAKYSSEDLSAIDLLLKDAKFIESSDEETRVMFSTLHEKFDNFLQRQDAATSIPTQLQAENCQLWVGLAPVQEDESQKPFKPVLIYSVVEPLKKEVDQALMFFQNPSLELAKVEDTRLDQNYILYRMYNIKASRKQVLPIVQSFIQ